MKEKTFKRIMWIIAMIIPFAAAILFSEEWLYMYIGLAVYRFFNE